MKAICIILLFICGCGHIERQAVTLNDLAYLDPRTSTTQHPLVCGEGKDFPEGSEFAFRNPQSREFVHAVFPGHIERPETFDGQFILRGDYQSIQNRKTYTIKQPPEGYRYFVVSSWDRTK